MQILRAFRFDPSRGDSLSLPSAHALTSNRAHNMVRRFLTTKSKTGKAEEAKKESQKNRKQKLLILIQSSLF
jgi:hypothetical protein